MKLNNDCVRDILFTVEDNTGYNKHLIFHANKANCDKLKKYDNDEIMYHIIQCTKAYLIEAGQIDLSGNILIKDLTPRGHEFINNIREDNNWNKVKRYI